MSRQPLSEDNVVAPWAMWEPVTGARLTSTASRLDIWGVCAWLKFCSFSEERIVSRKNKIKGSLRVRSLLLTHTVAKPYIKNQLRLANSSLGARRPLLASGFVGAGSSTVFFFQIAQHLGEEGRMGTKGRKYGSGKCVGETRSRGIRSSRRTHGSACAWECRCWRRQPRGWSTARQEEGGGNGDLQPAERESPP